MRDTDRLKNRPVEVELNDIVLPSYTNRYNTLFGGKLMELIDKSAAICAMRFCHQHVVTASVEAVDFHTPIKEGYFIQLKAKTILVGKTSVMVRVHVWGEEPISGRKDHCCTAYINMVAIDTAAKPVTVPELDLRSDEERLDWDEGVHIKQNTISRRDKIKTKPSIN